MPILMCRDSREERREDLRLTQLVLSVKRHHGPAYSLLPDPQIQDQIVTVDSDRHDADAMLISRFRCVT
jgi:hypothetical protein